MFGAPPGDLRVLRDGGHVQGAAAEEVLSQQVRGTCDRTAEAEAACFLFQVFCWPCFFPCLDLVLILVQTLDVT